MTSDEVRPAEEGQDPLRRALKRLPPVKAAPDFEARLQRRLGEPDRGEERGLAWRKFIPAMRMPAFGYSLLAIVAVGFVSYYMFRRTEVAPPANREPVFPAQPNSAVVPPHPPVLKQGEAGSAAQSESPGESPATGTAAGKYAVQSGARRKEADKAAQEPQATDGRAASPSVGENSENAVTARKEAAANAKDEVNPSPPKVELRQNPREEAEKSRTISTQLKKAQGLPPATSGIKRGDVYQQEFRVAAQAASIDSTAIRDSLRLDSLKREGQNRQLRRGKGKKPGA